MANALAFNITAVDRATKVVLDFNKRVSQMTRPFEEMRRSLQRFGRAAGFGVVREKLEGLGRTAKRVATAFGRIGAPLLALVGGGTIAGLYALTTGWARFGLQLSQSARILWINAQELYNFQNAARLVGVSGEVATQSYQAFANTLQDARFGRNQQAMGLLLGLGVHLRNTKSGSIDAMGALGQVADKIQKFQQSGHFGAARTLAQQLGLTSMLPVLMQGRQALEAYERQAQKLTGAMNWQQAAAAAMQWNRLSVAMEGTKNSIGSALLPVVTPLVQQFVAWVQANRQVIATDIGDFIKGLGQAFKGMSLKTFLDDILKIIKGMLDLVKGVARLTQELGGLKGILEGVAVLWAAPKVLQFGLAFYRMTGWINQARKAFMAWRAAQGLGAAAGAGGLAAAGGIGLLGGAAVYGGAKWWEHDQLTKLRNSAIVASPLAPAVMRYFMRQGWSLTQAAGIAANIQAESSFNPRAVGDNGAAMGIGQWHPDRQAAFNAWALRNRLPGLSQADLSEQLQFYNYELRNSAAGRRLAGANSAYDAGAIVSLYDERPADAAGQAASRGALATQLAGPQPPVNVSVQTTVHRDGSASTRVQSPSGVKIVHTSPVDGVA